jgi:hypothetical protein
MSSLQGLMILFLLITLLVVAGLVMVLWRRRTRDVAARPQAKPVAWKEE